MVLFHTPPPSKPVTAYPPSGNHHTSFSCRLWYMTSYSTNVGSLVMHHYSVSVLFSPLTHHTSHLNCISSNLFPPRHPHAVVIPLSSATSSPRYPLANQCGPTYPLSLLTCPPCPNGYPFI
jgi:hypothetical protein